MAFNLLGVVNMPNKPQLAALFSLRERYEQAIQEAMESIAENKLKLMDPATPDSMRVVREGLIHSIEAEIHELAHAIDVINKVEAREIVQPSDDLTENFLGQIGMYSKQENDNVHIREISEALLENNPRQSKLRQAQAQPEAQPEASSRPGQDSSEASAKHGPSAEKKFVTKEDTNLLKEEANPVKDVSNPISAPIQKKFVTKEDNNPISAPIQKKFVTKEDNNPVSPRIQEDISKKESAAKENATSKYRILVNESRSTQDSDEKQMPKRKGP